MTTKINKISNNDETNILFDEDKNQVKKEKKRKSASNKYYNLPEDEIQIIIAEAKDEIFHNKLPRIIQAISSPELDDEAKCKEIFKRFVIDKDLLDQAYKAKIGELEIKPFRDQAQKQLLEIFSNFINKYVSLLYKGKYDLHDYDTRRFVGLFVSDKDTQMRLRYNKINHKTFKDVNEVMTGISFMITRYGNEDDVRETVQMSFLHCVAKYKRKESIPFSGFIYNYMFYILQKSVEEYLIDQNGRHTFALYTDDVVSSAFMPEGMDPNFVANNTPVTNPLEDLLGPDKIDEYWVLGDTAVFPFDQLSVHQRQLLKWRYIDNIKASQIALKTTEHPNTCRAQLQEIRDQLVDILKEDMAF